MLNLASFRYRNVLAENGGPVARLETGPFDLRGRAVTLANATLRPGLARRHDLSIFSATADGSGVHELPAVARHIAVSEALERWCFASLVGSEHAADYGFDIDPTSCGMSAFPGLFGRQARKRSVLEAIERYCLIAWWEGRLPGRRFDTDWPGISAVAIDGPFGGITVVVYGRTSWGGYVYGHAADESFSGACERAIRELARHESALRAWWLGRLVRTGKPLTNVFERRLAFFASPEGFERFQRRVNTIAAPTCPEPEIICDAEIPGPWSEYATVWRFALRPPGLGFLEPVQDYFFL